MSGTYSILRLTCELNYFLDFTYINMNYLIKLAIGIYLAVKLRNIKSQMYNFSEFKIICQRIINKMYKLNEQTK